MTKIEKARELLKQMTEDERLELKDYVMLKMIN